MKKILYILCAVFALASCTKEELPTMDDQNADGTYTFNLGVEEIDTRAAVTMSRYVMEMYEGDLMATPIQQSNSTGVFNVKLKKNVDYVCLFWADNGTTYDVTSLKAVKQADETKLGTAAYSAKAMVNAKTFNGAITLKRAVAELSFIDKNGLTEAKNTLKITYPYASATFNLGDGTVAHATGSAVRTITNIAPPADKTTAFTTDYVLAPTEAGRIVGLKFRLNTETEKTIAEIAIKANVKTKIMGEYRFIPPAEIGDFYLKNDTWIGKDEKLTAAQRANCIGIVFYVNPDGKSGKIVGLNELKDEQWSTMKVAHNATSTTDGLVNMKAIAKYIADNGKSWNDFLAFKWAAQQNDKVDGGWEETDRWYIPAQEELKALYGEYDEAGTNIDYGYVRIMVTISQDYLGATQFSTSDYYWSSTESVGAAWLVYFLSGATAKDDKTETARVRVISTF